MLGWLGVSTGFCMGGDAIGFGWGSGLSVPLRCAAGAGRECDTILYRGWGKMPQ